MKKQVNPMLPIPKGLTTHPSMKAPAVKLLTRFHELRGELLKSLTEAGVSKKSAIKSLNGDIDLYEKVKEPKTKKKLVVVEKTTRKTYVRLNANQKKALRKDAKKLSVSELSAKYGVSQSTVNRVCNSTI